MSILVVRGTDTIAHKGQRNPCYGHNIARHAHIDQDMKGKHRNNPNSKQGSKIIACMKGNRDAPDDDNQVENQDQCHPNKPKLFAGHGENKVRVIFRKKVKAGSGFH